MSLSVLFPALNNIRLDRFLLDAKEIWGQDIWGWISDANSIFNIQIWFTFDIKIFDPIDIWRQYIWQQCHSTTRILRPMRSFRFLMPKLFFIHLMMRNLTTRNLMQKWIFKPFMLRNFLAFLDTTYFKDLNCHKVGGGRAARRRRRRRKNVACFSKCRKWNFWRLERCCCCWKRILASRREK